VNDIIGQQKVNANLSGGIMAAVPDITRKAVWDTLCDLEWHIRYCSALADRNSFRHRMLRVAILAGVIAEAVLLYGGTLSTWVFIPSAVGGVLLAGVTVWEATSDHANNAAVFRMVVILCQRLRTETEALWRDVELDHKTATEIEEALRRIHGQWGDVTQSIPLGIDEKMNRATAEAADQEMQNRYNTQLSSQPA
jgi:hypothetical protein